jgi:hypothetical protein
MAEEMLKIGRDSQFYLQGNLISIKDVGNLNDYLVQLLAFNTTLEEGITLSELIHALYGMNKFIVDYFSEEYEVARAFAISTKLDRKMSNITFYKSFRVESDDFLDDDEYVYIIPEIKIEDISFFIAEDGITLLVNNDGKRYPVDYSMDALEALISPDSFFRINRKVLVNINKIHSDCIYVSKRLQPTSSYLL